MRRKISLLPLFLLVLFLIPRASFAATVTLTLNSSPGSPYDFTVNGSTSTTLSCLNNNLQVNTGETWTATADSLYTLVTTDTKSTNVGGITVGELEEDAYLFTQYTSSATSTTNTEVQDAIWSVLDGTDVYSGLTGGTNGTEDTAVRNLVTAAANSANTQAASFYQGFTYYIPLTWDQSGDNDQSGGEPQQFLGYSAPVSAVPEPSSFLLLGTGIVGIAGMVRRRLMV